MSPTTFEKHCNDLKEIADQIVAAKRPDYTQGNPDVLHNFKAAAERAGITPLQAWLVHFEKQYSAICKMVKDPNGRFSESAQSRFADLHNYLFLGWGLVNETTELNTPQ